VTSCSALVDMRYLAQVMAHIQIRKIEALPVSSFSRSN
jgi:hypothetical protein